MPLTGRDFGWEFTWKINKKHFQLNLIGVCCNLIDKRKCLAINVGVDVLCHKLLSHVVTVLWILNT